MMGVNPNASSVVHWNEFPKTEPEVGSFCLVTFLTTYNDFEPSHYRQRVTYAQYIGHGVWRRSFGFSKLENVVAWAENPDPYQGSFSA